MKKIFYGLVASSMLFATPNNPSSLTFSNITKNSVTLNWQDNSNNESGFKIFRDGSLIALVKPNVRSFTDKNLEKSTTYSYTVKSTDDDKLKNILFAHGYQSSSETWDIFANYTEQVGGYNIYRYSVLKDGSIKTRATQLAQHIVADSSKIADHSLISVAHSMGGLDLRYIVSLAHKNESDKNNLFYKAAKKISKIYTLATPHKGTGLVGVDDATKDMEDDNMKAFNEAYPYSTYTIDGRKIPLLAYRFKCGDEKSSDGSNPRYADDNDIDGVIFSKKQYFNGAPFTQTIFSGKHTDDALCLESSDVELEQTDILQDILDQKNEPSDVRDIVFYEDNSCKGDEAGAFSSSYKIGGVRCLGNDECDDNKISSMMIYPNIKKDTTIELYSNKSDSTTDDWAIISIGDIKIDRPICIGSFESELSSSVKSKGIEMEYHKVDFGEDGLDGKVSYVKVD
jgi:hypothetical protein